MENKLRRDDLPVEVVHVDLADQNSIAALVAATGEAERVAIAAGICTSAPALETTREQIDSVMAINMVFFFTAQGYSREMVRRRTGSIVAIGSISGRFPRMGQIAYGAAKAGMRQALRILALETVPLGVRINVVSPGPTETEMMHKLIADHPDLKNLAAGNLDSFRQAVPDALGALQYEWQLSIKQGDNYLDGDVDGEACEGLR